MTRPIEERRLITILFADLSGFTTLSRVLDPEEVREVVNVCFESLNEAVIQEGGVIHKYEGDLVIALFGLPAVHEDDPERAIRAGLRMMGLIPSINETIGKKLRRKTTLGLHAGINSGTVFVGEVGSLEKREYTIMGDAVNLTSRLKDVAGPGELIVSETVFRASRYMFDYEPRPPVTLKGFAEPVKVFRPTGVKPRPEPKRGIKGLQSPLVGRKAELTAVRGAIDRLSTGIGGAVFVLGDAGLGKTRLLSELKQQLAPGRVECLEGRCQSSSENVPYLAILQILQAVFSIGEHDSRGVVKECLLSKTREFFPGEWETVAPYLGHLFSVRFEDGLDEKIRHLSPENLHTQVRASVRKLLFAQAKEHPVMLVIEDYHWIDRASLELVDFVFSAEEGAFMPERTPLLLLALSRVEKEKAPYELKEELKKRLGEHCLEIVLKPLAEAETSEFIRNLLDVSGIPESLRRRIIERAEGNPFYIEEIIRSLIDAGVLVLQDGVWRVRPGAAPESLTEIPSTVQAVIAARLDKLDPEVRSVLQAASVIGRSFGAAVLERLGGEDSLMLSVHLATLEDFEYIAATSQGREVEYVFRHPLLHEVAYNGLLKRRRRELHLRIGGIVEGLYADRLDEFAEFLANQYYRSDNSAKALFWLQRAGQKARERYTLAEASTFYGRITELLEDSDFSTAEHRMLAQEAHEALGDAYRLRGDYERALESYRRLEALAVDKNDPVLAHSRLKRAMIDVHRGSLDQALANLDQADALLSGSSEEVMLERAEVGTRRGQVMRLKGRTEDARRAVLQSIEAAETVVGRKPGTDVARRAKKIIASSHHDLGLTFAVLGRYEEAVALYRQCITDFQELGDKFAVASAMHNLGRIYQDLGESHKALDMFVKSLDTFERIGFGQGVATAHNSIGYTYHELGDLKKADEMYRKYWAISQEIGYKRGIGGAQCNLGAIHRERGEYEPALAYFQNYLRGAEEMDDRGEIGDAHAAIALLFLDQGKNEQGFAHIEKAEVVFRSMNEKRNLLDVLRTKAELLMGSDAGRSLACAHEALALSGEIGSDFCLGNSHLTMGRVSLAVGDLSNAARNLKVAVDLLVKVGQKKPMADAYLEYARFLKSQTVRNGLPREEAEVYFRKARQLYEEMGLPNIVAKCVW